MVTTQTLLAETASLQEGPGGRAEGPRVTFSDGGASHLSTVLQLTPVIDDLDCMSAMSNHNPETSHPFDEPDMRGEVRWAKFCEDTFEAGDELIRKACDIMMLPRDYPFEIKVQNLSVPFNGPSIYNRWHLLGYRYCCMKSATF